MPRANDTTPPSVMSPTQSRGPVVAKSSVDRCTVVTGSVVEVVAAGTADGAVVEVGDGDVGTGANCCANAGATDGATARSPIAPAITNLRNMDAPDQLSPPGR